MNRQLLHQYPYGVAPGMPGAPPAGDGVHQRAEHYAAQMPPPPMVQPAFSPLGQAGQRGQMLRDDPAFARFDKIPAFYTVTVQLGGAAGATNANSTPLRPESFICEMISWACNEAPKDYADPAAPGVAICGSPQGRSVRVSWGDEFTRFLGKTPALLSSLFGDSNGFLNLPRGILFQGKQTLEVNLRRIYDPLPAAVGPQEKEFDFTFHGVGLFPPGVSASGSAG